MINRSLLWPRPVDHLAKKRLTTTATKHFYQSLTEWLCAFQTNAGLEFQAKERAKHMRMRIIPIVLLVLAIAAILPSPPESRKHQAQTKAQPEETYVGSAIDSVVDLDFLCEQQEGVCTTATHVIKRVEDKALYNIGLLYEWARSEHVGVDRSPLGNQAEATFLRPTKVSRRKSVSNTLKLDDLLPRWRGPDEATDI
jgi:hypothetical protein